LRNNKNFSLKEWMIKSKEHSRNAIVWQDFFVIDNIKDGKIYEVLFLSSIFLNIKFNEKGKLNFLVENVYDKIQSIFPDDISTYDKIIELLKEEESYKYEKMKDVLVFLRNVSSTLSSIEKAILGSGYNLQSAILRFKNFEKCIEDLDESDKDLKNVKIVFNLLKKGG
jgi:hypothetical protein